MGAPREIGGLDLRASPLDGSRVDDVSVLRLVEVASLAILAGFFVLMGRASGGKGAPLSELAIIAVASWVAEVSCIRLYRFYQYDAPWLLFVDVMPLLVACIWPFVILSARQVSGSFGIRGGLGVFLFVLYDAFLVEPLAVAARLWSWNEPGVFGVPVIGILGWAYFAFFTILGLERLEGRRRILIIVLAPLFTHLALLASWWGLLRWVLRAELSGSTLALVSLSVAGLLAVLIRRRRLGAPLPVMLPRMAAAALFFGLLALRGRGVPWLPLYALPFAVPYLLATRWRLDSKI